MNPIYNTDFYKTGHINQFPKGTSLVYSNLTPRGSRMEGVDRMVFFGLQYYCLKYLIEDWNYNFFMQKEHKIVAEYDNFIERTLSKDAAGSEHIKKLHRLGHLPIKIKALKEGMLVPMRVPCLTIENTHPDFYWLTNFLETSLSATLWGMCTSATTSFQYRQNAEKYAELTCKDNSHVPFSHHDFALRGMFGLEAGAMSGAAHLLSFVGTDTIPAIHFLHQYYGADINQELIGCSVPASEHAVMTLSASVEGEFESYKRLLTETYPKGIVSLVCDSFDFFRVITDYLPSLKETILARDGKLVIRPDSSPKTPLEILCGDLEMPMNSPEYKGLIQLLWEIFGGYTNLKGYKVLDSHIGAIYGEAISPIMQDAIYKNLATKGFASSNVIFGIGSYSFTFKTRDSLGLAVKATAAIVDEKEYLIYKSPKTDSGTKKSARGFLKVIKQDGELVLLDGLTRIQAEGGLLEDVFVDGRLVRHQKLLEIRELVSRNIERME